MYEAIKEILTTDAYDFLRQEEHLAPGGKTKNTEDGIVLGKSITMLALGGSYAYGTNTEIRDKRGEDYGKRRKCSCIQGYRKVMQDE